MAKGRKKEITLEVNKKTGEIKVIRNYSALDVILVTEEGAKATSLTPREMLILEKKKDGKIVVKECPPEIKVNTVVFDPDAPIIEEPKKEDTDGTTGAVRAIDPAV